MARLKTRRKNWELDRTGNKFSRREFIMAAGAAAAAAQLGGREVLAEAPKSEIVVITGTDIPAMVTAGMKKLGGFERFVKTGKKATIKPNAGWASRPDQAGNTHPEVVRALVAGCVAAGAAEVVLPEKTCSPAPKAFKLSGIEEASAEAGGRLYALKNAQFKKTKIPMGKKLKRAQIATDVLETGCLINVPVAKSHGGAGLTLSMKNWMGSVRNRKEWHSNGLDQCIADFSTLIKPDLVVIDATRIMLTGGPRGPGRVETKNKLVFGTDPVACDAYASTLFGKKPFDVPHIKIAHDMGIGQGDLTKVEIVEISAQ